MASVRSRWQRTGQEKGHTVSRRSTPFRWRSVVFLLFQQTRAAASALRTLCPSASTLTILFLLGCLVLLGITYSATQHTVLLDINGTLIAHRTHQQSAEGVLRELGVPLEAEDQLKAPAEAELLGGEPIRVTIARPAVLVHDGSVTQVRSQASDIAGVLSQMGVGVFPHDQLYLAGKRCTPYTRLPQPEVAARPSVRALLEALKRPVRLALRRAVQVTVQDGTVPMSFYTTARTLGAALFERDIIVYVGDRIFPNLRTGISPGLRVVIERSKPITLDVGGDQVALRTGHKTVRDLLQAERISLGPKDRILPDPRSAITSELHVAVVRVHDEYYIEETPIPFETRWEPDPETEIDRREVASWGREGAKRRRIRVHYENDEEVYRTEEEEWIAHQPLSRIIRYGTMILLRQLETPEGTLTYWRKLRVLATSYNAPTAGKPRDHPTYSITRTGTRARKGVIAVDPRVIRLGQRMYVPGYGSGVAEDTGGAIEWRRIDLCYDDDNLVLWYRWVDAYLLTPVSAYENIRWMVPNSPTERE